MRILIAYRYFAPDTPPYASMLSEMTRWFSEAGHDVEMVTAQPSYKPSANIPKQAWREQHGNLQIRRLWLFPEKGMGLAKIINSALFILRAFFIILFGPKRDLIWTATMPPVLQAYMLSAAARIRGAQFLYHMQDIHPEISHVVDGEMRQGFLFKILRRLDIKSLRRAKCAVVLSPDMADILVERGVDAETPRVIRNFALGDEEADELLAQKTAGPEENGPLKFVFAGNVGLYQNLERLVAAFARLDPKQLELVIVGEGRAKPGLQKMVADRSIANVFFRDHMSEQQVFSFLCEQHVGLVSLSPGLYKYAFPSKIWTYMAADLPMLAMVEGNSDLAGFLSSNALGMHVSWDADEAALADIVSAVSAKVRAHELRPGQHKNLYHREAARKSWLELLEEIDPDGEAAG